MTLYDIPLWLFFITLSLLLMGASQLGAFIRRKARNPDEQSSKSSFIIEGTLLSMLLSFTFSMAAGKYDKRKSVFESEINNISTVLLRTRLYPDSITVKLNGYMRGYIESRIAYYDAGDNVQKIKHAIMVSDSVSQLLFNEVATCAKNPQYTTFTQQMVPALNNMIDSITSREISRNAKVPLSVLRLLMVLSLIVSFMNGYNQGIKKANQIQAFGYSILIALTFILILDLNDSRRGVIDLSLEQNMLIKIRDDLAK